MFICYCWIKGGAIFESMVTKDLIFNSVQIFYSRVGKTSNVNGNHLIQREAHPVYIYIYYAVLFNNKICFSMFL